LSQKIERLEKILGPEYVALMDGLQKLGPENKKRVADIMLRCRENGQSALAPQNLTNGHAKRFVSKDAKPQFVKTSAWMSARQNVI
jgi:hypothetical protein